MRNLVKALGGLLLVACTCYPATIINLDYVFQGASPGGTPPPWLTATFTDVSGGVQLEMTATNLLPDEFVSEWLFNIDSISVSSLGFLFLTGPPSVTAPSLVTSGPQLKADGDGYYDFGFQYATAESGRFSTGTVTYLITGPPTLDAADFYAFSVGGDKGAFLSAAHVQGITTTGPSGWIGNEIPEPASIVLFGAGIGLIGLGAAVRRRISG